MGYHSLIVLNIVVGLCCSRNVPDYNTQYNPSDCSSDYRVEKRKMVMFGKSDLYLVALLWKMFCILGDPMSLRHLVQYPIQSVGL